MDTGAAAAGVAVIGAQWCSSAGSHIYGGESCTPNYVKITEDPGREDHHFSYFVSFCSNGLHYSS